jgi:hypothetical protein
VCVIQDDSPSEAEDNIAHVGIKRNHGARVDGPWVFGLCQGNDCRYFVVERHDKGTLKPLIERECQRGSVIHSDKWPPYALLQLLASNILR